MATRQPTADVQTTARAYAELFPAVYLRLHRRDGKQRELSGASRAVLLHLTLSGPLSVGECAKHLGRSQSVVSEIVDQLEQHRLLARVRDEHDHRRMLVWLTDQGRARLAAEQEVLSVTLLEQAVSGLAPRHRTMLLEATRALIDAADRAVRPSAATPATKRGNHEP